MDINKFLENYGYSKEFNLAVCDEIRDIPDTVPLSELKRRKCLFDEKIVTIDGDDSKDFDDAVSIKRLKNGKYVLGVHIADVSHYVREKTALDTEALNRGTSVYLANHVVPMLPYKLSDNVCSLLPGEVRLTLSCIMKIGETGNVEDYSLCETAIKSSARMTYKQVAGILDGDMALRNEYFEFVQMFEDMRCLSLVLRDRRMRRGAIDFDFPEPYFSVDENDKVLNVEKRELKISNRIIEEFMLLANETVAKHCVKSGIPCVYRVHESPDIEKTEKLSKAVKIFGHKFKNKENISPKAIQSLLFRANGTNAQAVLGTLALRSMMKARYSDENLGHFGLAAECYCHFTSPIRRYPDLLVHRILKESIKKPLDERRISHYNKIAKRVAEQSTDTEINAVSAEREYDSILYCEYMSDKIGWEFNGIISSVTDFGFFAELENTVEGLVRMTDLQDDYYEYNEDTLMLVGKRSGRVFFMGQPVSVKLAKVNTELKQIDFVLNEFKTEKPKKEVKNKYAVQRKRKKGNRKKKYRSK